MYRFLGVGGSGFPEQVQIVAGSDPVLMLRPGIGGYHYNFHPREPEERGFSGLIRPEQPPQGKSWRGWRGARSPQAELKSWLVGEAILL